MDRYSLDRRHKWPRALLMVCLCALLAGFAACSDDDTVAPTTTGPPPDNGDALPAVPVLASPTADPPARSETVTRTRPAYDYAPRIKTALVDWHIRAHAVYEEAPTWIDCSGGWRDLFGSSVQPVREWNDVIPPVSGCFGACGLVARYCPQSWPVKFDEWPADARIHFISEGVTDATPNTVQWMTQSPNYCRIDIWPVGCVSRVRVRTEHNATGPAIQDAPYLIRERFWEIKEWESGALVHRIDGDSETWMKTEYSTGCDRTETESFAWTLGASIGAEFKGLAAQIEGSITKTFETSITVSERNTTSVDKHLKGVAGKTTCHVMWVLVERYRFIHKNGDRFDDPNYVLHEGFHDPLSDTYYDFEIRGTQEHVARYTFDHSGALLDVVILD